MRASWLVLAEDPSSAARWTARIPGLALDPTTAAHDAILVVGSPSWAREAIRRFRARGGRAPIVLVAATEATPVAAYADDVVREPVTETALDESLLRIAQRVPAVLRLGGVDVDLRRGVAIRDGQELGLTPTEVAFVRHLWTKRNTTVSREALHEIVWGYAPTVVSRAVDLAAHRLRPKIEPDPRNPRFLVTVRGLGYRLDVDAEPNGPAPAVRSPPVETTTFVGRTSEIDALALEIGRGARVVSVLGPAGIGKTRLVRRFVASRKGDPPALFVDLGGAQGRADVLDLTARALALSSDDPIAIGATLGRRGRALVLLDDVERVAVDVAALLSTWIPLASETCFLVTSRVRLRVEGEVPIELGPLSPSEAAALFCDRAAAIGRTFEIGDRSIGALVDQLDRLPLAIELAAARSDLFTPADMLERLDQRFRLLADRRSDRTQSLEAALASSWDLLDPTEQAVAAQCGVFRGGFTVDSAEAVVDAANAWIPDVLRELTDQSILRSESVDHSIRLTMYDSIQAFLWERAIDRDRVAERHTMHFLSLVERWTHGEAIARTAVLRELPNLLQACAAARDVEVSARIALALDPVLAAWGPNGVLRDLLDRVLERRPSDARTARLSIARARAHIREGHVDAAQRDVDQARVLGERGTADWTEGLLAMHRGDFARAREWFESALVSLEREDDVAGQGVVLQNLGTIAMREGRLDDADAFLTRAIASHRSAGRPFAEGRALGAVANLSLERGDLAGARASYTAASRSYRAHGDRLAEGRLLANVASLDLDEGKLGAAHDGYVDALAIHREIGDRALEGITLGNLGVVELLLGRLPSARSSLERSVALLESVQAWHPRAVFRAHLAVLAESGDEMLDEAERALAGDESGRLVVEIARRHRAALARPADDAGLEDLRRRAAASRSSDARAALAMLERTLQIPGSK